MKNLVKGFLALGLLAGVVNADVFTNKDCNDPVKISALSSYYKDFEKNKGEPAPKFDDKKFKLFAENKGKHIFKVLPAEDAYICRVDTKGMIYAGDEFLMVRIDGKVYIYDRQYDFGKYSNDTSSIDFVKKYGIQLN